MTPASGTIEGQSTLRRQMSCMGWNRSPKGAKHVYPDDRSSTTGQVSAAATINPTPESPEVQNDE
jgi:hypothetical protein